MASLQKFTSSSVLYEMRHNTRETPKLPSNVDIDPQRTPANFSLAPADRGGAQPKGGSAAKAAREYHKRRLSEVYVYRRADVVTACQWVITAPSDLQPEQEPDFWWQTYSFLNGLYGEENCVQAVIHTDEGLKLDGKVVAGRAHMHYMFIPVVRNDKYQKPNRYGNISGSALYREKVCADALITKQHLREFHPRFQKWLDEHGIQCTVHTGTTEGKNRTVDELKRETLEKELSKAREKLAAITKDYQALRQVAAVHSQELAQRSRELAEARNEVHDLRAEKSVLQERIAALEHEYEQKNIDMSGWGNGSSWGSHNNGWGKEKNTEWTRTF